MSRVEAIPDLIRELYSVVDRLEALFPERKFTPDGHLVGSIGVVLATHHYGVSPLPDSAPIHDAQAADGRMVQIKLTQAGSVGLRAEPEHLLVLLLSRDGAVSEVYNGPGYLAWSKAGKMQSNGQRSISGTRLRELMNSVPQEARLERLAV